jgi:hypothetical protein
MRHIDAHKYAYYTRQHVLCLKASITKPIGNNIKLEIPISLNSGVAHSMDHDDLDSFSQRMELLFHTSDLPPYARYSLFFIRSTHLPCIELIGRSYWEGDGHNWDDNEKA